MKFRDRSKLLYVLAFLLFLLVYHFSIAPTIEQFRVLHKKEIQLKSISNLPVKIKTIKNEIEQIDRIIGDVKQEYKGSRRRKLLETISNYCGKKHVTIKKITRPEYIEQNNVMVELNQVLLKGRFAELLRFVYYMEERQVLGHVTSFSFFMEKDIRTKEKSLGLLVYFQTISENKLKKLK